MSRVSHAKQQLYSAVIRSGQDESSCYFCGNPSSMQDYTPSASASDRDKELFLDPWTRTHTCNKCWRRIYTVNMAEAGARFNVHRGCMTLKQKEALLGGDEATKSVAGSVSRYSMAFDPPIIAPLGLNQLEENQFIWGSKTVYREELMTLQGGFALQMVGSSATAVEWFLISVMMSDDLNGDNIDLYREMLGLKSQKEMIHGSAD